jgi:hypothetical protein
MAECVGRNLRRHGTTLSLSCIVWELHSRAVISRITFQQKKSKSSETKQTIDLFLMLSHAFSCFLMLSQQHSSSNCNRQYITYSNNQPARPIQRFNSIDALRKCGADRPFNDARQRQATHSFPFLQVVTSTHVSIMQAGQAFATFLHVPLSTYSRQSRGLVPTSTSDKTRLRNQGTCTRLTVVCSSSNVLQSRL